MTDYNETWIQNFPSGLKWFNSLPSFHTRRVFISYFKAYIEATKKTPEQLIALKIEGLKNTGNEREFLAEDLLEDYLRKCNLKPTAKLMLKNTIFSFYKHNRRALNPETATTIKNKYLIPTNSSYTLYL